MPAEAIILTSQLILQRFKCRSRCTGQQYFLTTCSCGVGDTHHPSEAELHDSHSSWWRYHRCDKMTTALVQRFFGLMDAFHFDHSSLICQMWDLLCLPFLWVSSSVYSDKLPQRKRKKKTTWGASCSFYTGWQWVEAQESNSTAATSSNWWKWLPADETFTQEEFNIKKQISKGAKATDRYFSDNAGRLTSANKNLTNTTAEVFALMRLAMSQCWYAAPSHYLPHSQTGNQPFGHFNQRTVTVAAGSPLLTQQPNTGQFTSIQWFTLLQLH